MKARKVSARSTTGVCAALGTALAGGALISSAAAQDVLPAPPAPFTGQIGLSVKDSRSDFPQPVKAPKGAPNVVIILLDDVGYGASSTFGGPCDTPTLDRLAANGLRYTQFHTTAISSPTRASLLTGRNHHTVHTGNIMEFATGFPGYDSVMGKDTATVAEVLRQKGFNTAWFGKNHNVPDWHNSLGGPFDLWPTGLGFEKFYGFIGAETDQWRPALFDGTNPVEPYLGNPDYHFDDDLAEKAIEWVRAQNAVAPDKPFFLYYAPGATHSPHHPRKEWITKYKGRFDQGWDKVREETLARQKKLGIVPANTKLTERSHGLPAWDSLGAEQKRLYAYMMEVYAGFLSQTDYNAGRVLDAIDRMGQLDNTLVIYICGDNGASSEGRLQGSYNELAMLNMIPEDYKDILKQKDNLGTWKTHNHYPAAWAHAMNAPFQWVKTNASHYGGTANGMVISWPARIRDRGGIRTQWHHVIDIVPTIYEATGIEQPSMVNGVTQKPIEGVSMAYSFDSPKAPSTRHTQYFEVFGHRAIYHDGWLACTTPPYGGPWVDQTRIERVDVIDGYQWELYHVDNDFSEADNLAGTYPDRLHDLQLLFYAEAAKYNVLPLDDSGTERMAPGIRPSITAGRTEFVYTGPVKRIHEGSAPDIKNRSFRITADVVLPTGGEQGVLVTQGGLSGGFALVLEKGKPAFYYNMANVSHYSVASEQALKPGKHTVVFDFLYDGGGIGKGGTGTLSVDGKQVVQGRIGNTVPFRFSMDETFDVGEDTGTPVDLAYDVPFRFTGTIDKLVVTYTGDGTLTAVDQRKVNAVEAKITAD
ncbi:MAG: Arylsulfatase [Deltaproteobacteria bacterium ADurb.Bin072]|nr:MAG: Arylsulfatase [Deltaproteobacteria bacterium ADurb.Bin072]